MNKELKILHIIDSLGLGGAQTVVKGIFEFQKDNKNIFLFALRKRNILMEVNHSNVKIFNSTKKYSLLPLFELKDLIVKENIDVLHCHLFKSQVFGFLLKKIWFKDIKLIFHEHGEIFQGHIIYNLFMRLSRNCTDKIVAVSNITKGKLIAKTDIEENKIGVLPNFVDINKFNRNNITWNIEEEKNKLGIKEGEFVIGFVGRLAKVKGCEYLIKALPYLDIPYKVLIVGEGPERVNLQKSAVKLKVADKILFLGYRSDTVFIESLLDVLVVPSLNEASPMSLYEAQAMKVAVIASNINSISEFINDKESGLLFEPLNHISFAQKINILEKDLKLKEVIINNSSICVEKFGLEFYLINLKKIYE